jgi:hypothetical protein
MGLFKWLVLGGLGLFLLAPMLGRVSGVAAAMVAMIDFRVLVSVGLVLCIVVGLWLVSDATP